jgi:proline iminopeptidase
MTETQLAPNLPQWMKDHADRYLKSGGTDGHIYTLSRPARSRQLTVSVALPRLAS